MSQSPYTSRSAGFLMSFLLLLFIIQEGNCQLPKREFRATWVATVANIDWPSRQGLSSGEQKEEIIRILDQNRANGVNAIILQVRPTADAIYPSELEPWSRFLSGTQGVAPLPYYDPLEFWIVESHRRGMELHAWFNPYRISLSLKDSLAENHTALEHPQWCFNYGGRQYFSPANPQVWDFVTRVVVDVVRRYDIDAVHFDDYFYPYDTGDPLPDSLEFVLLGNRFYPLKIKDWRRQNVDSIIQMLGNAIKAEKPWVKFGISPFGVWRNSDMDPMGSETTAGTSNYDGLYADVIRWQREGWIDYLMPQLYWRDDHPAVGFSNLAHWWNDHHYGHSIYVGLALYRIDRKSQHRQWKKDKYLLMQIEVLRQLKNIDGFGWFSSKHFFRDNLKSLNRKLQKHYCSRPALVPSMPWIDAFAPKAPKGLRMEEKRLVWDISEESDPLQEDRYYVIYHFKKGEDSKVKSGSHILYVSGENFFDFPKRIPAGSYRVSVLDRLNNESPLCEALVIQR